ncbi:hypothetical protein ACJMK2_004451 [Sinanodonta woodiana]|uniref:G-protein coupled receptors family 1 profile domain-containing protein n=1 Tax=Sinanodonta woodiana TaxID=1069815 RepID=A0ABD3Y177_SINWO
MDDLNISKEYYDKVMETKNIEKLEHLIPAFVMVTLFMIVGLPGNLFVIIVYYRKMRRTTSRYFIIVLAALDFINCVVTMPMELALLSNFYTFDLPWLCKLIRFITYSTQNSSAIILLGIAVDRFRNICQATKRSFSLKHVKIFCICSVIFATLSSTPSILLYGTNTKILPVVMELNLTIHGKTCLIEDKYWRSTFIAAFNAYIFCCNAIIFVVISIAYILIGKEMFIRKEFWSYRKKSITEELQREAEPSVNRNKSSLTSLSLKKHELETITECHKSETEKTENRISVTKTTCMLFLVTLFYIISFLPFLVIATFRNLKPDFYERMSVVENSIYNFFLRTYFLNNVINPILYGFLNEQFRRRVVQLFRECFCFSVNSACGSDI